jgi:hypothetical protein
MPINGGWLGCIMDICCGIIGGWFGCIMGWPIGGWPWGGEE